MSYRVTQVTRQKWLLWVGGANAFFALVLLGAVGLGLWGVRRAQGLQDDAARIRDYELRGVHEELVGLRGLSAAVQELRLERRTQKVEPPAADPQLAQALQLLALRALQSEPERPAARSARRRTAGRRARRPGLQSQGCKLPGPGSKSGTADAQRGNAPQETQPSHE